MDFSKTEIYIKILNMESVLFEGTVSSVSSYNESGIFDILPLHSNFITLISKKIILHTLEKTDREFDIQNGVLKVSENRVFIFLDV
jgi:F0F1-type ATP synthase epsilon subunit